MDIHLLQVSLIYFSVLQHC